jgi:hypothetical protein
MKKLSLILIAGIASQMLYSGDNFHLGEDRFNKRHSKVKEVYIRTISKNKAYTKTGNASYVKIRSKEEFKKALESGALNQKIDTNKVTKTYRAIEIDNVRLNKNDLKELTKNGNRVLIGSEVGKNDKLMQSINIKNSKIETDKKLNIGVVATDKKINGVTNYVNIDRSYIEGGNNKIKNTKKSREEIFKELEMADQMDLEKLKE